MDIFWFIVVGLATYSVSGIIIFNTALEGKRNRGARNYEDPDMLGVFFKACFWPLIYFVNAVMAAHKSSSEKVKEATAETKVKKHAESPIQILSQMIAAKILKEPENINRSGTTYYGAEYTWKNSEGNIVVVYEVEERRGSECPPALKTVSVNNKHQDVSESSIIEAIKAAIAHNKAKAKADAEAARQLKALEAVESLLLTPEPSTTTNEENK